MERWTEVDRTKDPTHFVRYLDSVSALDATAQYKRRSFRLLEPRDGDRFLEVGCGNGDDARELAQLVAPSGRVTAIDVSQTMVDEAARRGTEGVDFALGDAHELRYADASFDGVRIDRGDYHWQHEPCWYAVRKGKTAHWGGDRTQSTVWEIANLNPFGGYIDVENEITGTARSGAVSRDSWSTRACDRW